MFFVVALLLKFILQLRFPRNVSMCKNFVESVIISYIDSLWTAATLGNLPIQFVVFVCFYIFSIPYVLAVLIISPSTGRFQTELINISSTVLCRYNVLGYNIPSDIT